MRPLPQLALLLLALISFGGLPAPAQDPLTNALVVTNSTWSFRRGTNEPPAAWRNPGFDDSAWEPLPAPFHFGAGLDPADGTPLPGMLNNFICVFLRQTFDLPNPLAYTNLLLRVRLDDGLVAWINGVEVRRFGVNAGTLAHTNAANTDRATPYANFLTLNAGAQTNLRAGENILALQAINYRANSPDFLVDAELLGLGDFVLPYVIAQTPGPDAVVNSLTQIAVTFSEPVTNIFAEDLWVNGVPATGLSGGGSSYTFSFPEPAAGDIAITWDDEHNITDLSGNRLDQTTNAWNYLLIDVGPPYLAARTPAPDAVVSALTQVSVLFNEPVEGVDAADLTLNGTPCAGVVGTGPGPYVFTFTPPATGEVRLAFAPGSNIRDLGLPSNPFAGDEWTVNFNPNFSPSVIALNEFLAENLNGLRDEDNDTNDWIEVVNRGSSVVSLLGWSLTDDPGAPDQWVFPNVALAPNEHLVVFASAKDRRATNGQTRLHTNFRLNVNGEYLALYNANSPRQTVTEFAPAFPEQRPDVSYGLSTQGVYRYFTTPTPGRANTNASTIIGVTEPVHFSAQRGYYDRPFTLALSTPTPGAIIRYTTDFTVPTETVGRVYAANMPVLIASNTIVRAAAFRTNLLSSKVRTHSFFFPSNVFNQPGNPPGFPANWLTLTSNVTVPADYGMDPRVITNALYAPELRAALFALPALSITLPAGGLFSQGNGIYANPQQTGITWERPASAEFIFNTPQEDAFQLDAGLRVQGGSSRQETKTYKHSTRLLFRSDYGAGRLRYKLYGNETSQDTYNTLLMDAFLNLVWNHRGDAVQRRQAQYVRDQFASDLINQMGGLAFHGRYFHLYLDGLYWGVHDLHERPDAAWAASYYGGNPEEWDILKNTSTFEAVEGNFTAWNQMITLARAGLSASNNYVALEAACDLDSLIDYMMVNFWIGNTDWPHHNWYAGRQRVAGQKWRFFTWDAEHCLKDNANVDYSLIPANTSIANTPYEIYQNLRTQSPEFRLRFADRVQRHFYNGGVLSFTRGNSRWDPATPTNNPAAALYVKRLDEIRQAIILESARWGDTIDNTEQPGQPYTRNFGWSNEVNRLMAGWFPVRSSNVLNHFRNNGLLPSLAAPVFNQHGGLVQPGFSLSFSSAPSSTVYYTFDNTDPRRPHTGALYAGARTFIPGQGVELNGTTLVQARAFAGGLWSPLVTATFLVSNLLPPIRITEIMYDPPGGEPYEYFELLNLGTTPAFVGGWTMEGVNYTFPPGYVLYPGIGIVLANNSSPNSFRERYPFVFPAGYFSGNLSDTGERLALKDQAGRVVFSVIYNNGGGWPYEAAGRGHSLEMVDLNGDPNDSANWYASSFPFGTPEVYFPPPPPGSVRFNEIMADNFNEVANEGTFPDWVELYNHGATEAVLTDWSLSDDGDRRKHVFPAGTSVPAGGHLVVWCDAVTNASPGLHAGFALERNGEALSLYNPAGDRVDRIGFGPQPRNYALGRVPDGTGEWRLTAASPGLPNVAVPAGPPDALVINEFLANPPQGSGGDWVELFNTSATQPVALRGLYLQVGGDVARINALSFLPPLGFVQFFADAGAGHDSLGLRLPALGGTLKLDDAQGRELNRVTYGAQTEGVTQGRFPNGTGGLVSFPGNATPGASNAVVVYAGPRLNELMAFNRSFSTNATGLTADWIELYNPGPTNFPLAGMALSDDADQPAKWVFPAGASLPPGIYLQVWCDGVNPPSTNLAGQLNTGFSLDADSGAVFLFNALGQRVDGVTYGFQVPNRTIGLVGGQWRLTALSTPGAANSAVAQLGTVTNLRINEWLADPEFGDDWFELYNQSVQPLELSGLWLTDDFSQFGLLNTQIRPLSFIGPRGYVQFIADGNDDQGANHVDFALEQQGESLAILNTNLAIIDAITFGAQFPGVSEGRLPDGAATILGFATTQSPADSNHLPLPDVVINEVSARPAPGGQQFIELYNPTTNNVAVGGWWLSDLAEILQKHRIAAGTVVAPGGYLVLLASQFNAIPGSATNFALNPVEGGVLWLTAASPSGSVTGFRNLIEYGPADEGVAHGTVRTAQGVDFVALLTPTSGAVNAGPVISPVVLHEIHYHPPDDADGVDNVADEFIELRNLTGAAVPLFDAAGGWRLAGGVEFEFSSVLSANGHLLVVNFDPQNEALLASFRARYGVPFGVPVLGPFTSRLANGNDAVELRRRTTLINGAQPYILLDRVAYKESLPWPSAADGGGASLQKTNITGYGNEPLNWLAFAPTAGRPNNPAANPRPVIVTPPADVDMGEGRAVTFSVLAQGAPPLLYQWLHDGTNVPGARGAQLVLPAVTLAQAGQYRVLVTNLAGGVLSAPAELAVRERPRVLADPVSQTLVQGVNWMFTVAASGDAPLRYFWRHNGSVLDVPNEPAVTLLGVRPEDAGNYDVVITNSQGAVTSRVATLTVVVPPTITGQPENRIVAVGGLTRFAVAATGTAPLRYQWRYAGNPIPQATNAFLEIPDTQFVHAGNYSVEVGNTGGAVLSQIALLFVTSVDSDGDGLPDEWEQFYGLNATDATDANWDPDGDGLTNWQEFVACTNPLNPNDVVRIKGIAVTEIRGGFRLNFNVRQGCEHSILYAESLDAAFNPFGWQVLTNLGRADFDKECVLTNLAPAHVTQRFYRLSVARP